MFAGQSRGFGEQGFFECGFFEDGFRGMTFLTHGLGLVIRLKDIDVNSNTL
jgi:hypothetical protein